MTSSAEKLTLYRRRIIPDECILLKDDIVLRQTDEIIVTRWNTLKPKSTFHHGCSCYFLKEGFKVSRFYREDGSFIYWYCDIMDYDIQPETNTIIATDLLADVVVFPDGAIRVLDLDELALASENGLLDPRLLQTALRRLNSLLDLIYRDKFDRLTTVFADLDI
ncbi:MAG: DUF402 domain-containing protein [Lachnospiraceae bacterium]|nr:DUF402 domain-containing protein [Lachnospiraceae bacterium]